MNEKQIFQEIVQAKKDYGDKCPKKFTGALAVEVIRRQLLMRRISVSRHNVFIKGVTREIDLLIPKPQSSPKYDLLYEPEDVLIVLEIKNIGVFGETTLNAIRNHFHEIYEANRAIHCLYLTVTERKGYKWAASEENLGYPVYTLSWYSRTADRPGEFTGAWDKLLSDVNKIVSSSQKC